MSSDTPTYTMPGFRLNPPEGWLRLALNRCVYSHTDIGPWQVELRQALLDEVLRPPSRALEGAAPEATPGKLMERNGYTARRWLMPLWDEEEMPLWELTPPGNGPWPAVCLLPGHGQGARSAAGEIPSTDGQNALGRELARAGFLVAVPELRTLGERELSLPPGDWRGRRPHEIYANFALEVGTSLTALQFAEALMAWRWLVEQPQVQKERMGICGHSQGGRIAVLFAAAIPDVAAVVCSSGISSILETERGFSHAHDMLPGLLSLCDYPDLVAAIAPQPLMLCYGQGETGPYALECSRNLTRNRALPAYEYMNRSENLILKLHNGGHEHDTVGILNFFGQLL